MVALAEQLFCRELNDGFCIFFFGNRSSKDSVLPDKVERFVRNLCRGRVQTGLLETYNRFDMPEERHLVAKSFSFLFCVGLATCAASIIQIFFLNKLAF